MKNIVHIDLNAFFAQVEEIKDPSLIGKPVAIGHAYGRSVVSTANYVARTYGVHSGMPASQALKLCPQLILIEDHFREYGIYSNKFMSYLKAKFPIMEQASVDECYIDMTDCFKKEEAHDFLFDLQIELFKAVGLKCSIGVGDNRFLAKMASDYQKPLGLTVLYKENVPDILWPIPIEKMYGIGKKTFPRLKALGIQTIGDLAQTEDAKVKKLLGNMFIYQKAHANGDGSSEVHTTFDDPKSISSAYTFQFDTTDYDELKNQIIHNAKSVAKQLASYGKVTNTIVITFRDEGFNTSSKRLKFENFSDKEGDIVSWALRVFDKFYNGSPLRLIGVGVADIKDKEDVTEAITLFKSTAEEKESETTDIIDDFNRKLGGAKLTTASSLTKKKKEKIKPTSRFHKPENQL